MRSAAALFLVAVLAASAVGDTPVAGWAAPTDLACCPPGGDHGRLERLQFRGSTLLWWVGRDNADQPLLTTGTQAGAGILGRPDTVILSRAGDAIPAGPYVGGDFGVHYWVGPDQWLGIDGRFFFLGRRAGNVVASGDAAGQPVLSVPFTDLNPILPGPSYTQVSNPGASTGEVRFRNELHLWGTEVGFDLPSFAWDALEVSALAGVRYLDLEERYSIAQDVVSISNQTLLGFQGVGIPATDRLRITDRFRANNRFVGANLVARALYHVTPQLSVGLTGKAAIGSTHQVLRVSGSTFQVTPANGGFVPVAGSDIGLFAQPGILGRRAASRLSVIPEVEGRVAWAVSDRVEVSLGYGFLYWNQVLRPARQVPDTINTTTAPSQATFGGGGPLPTAPPFRSSSITAHGLNVGLTLRF